MLREIQLYNSYVHLTTHSIQPSNAESVGPALINSAFSDRIFHVVIIKAKQIFPPS